MDQLALFAPTETPPPRPWSAVRPGEQLTFTMPGSPWSGRWTVRRVEDHPHASYAVIVTLVDETGRTWATVPHREVLVPGLGWTFGWEG
ncbi:hypothetical protein [Micromonospora zhanjiangensis]|uniref:Uncharacterized protein n=1 Tax=Micromonospora zhanjiangensis TaxID=1522057 RepID=A0ABV8KPB4_9ACTN